MVAEAIGIEIWSGDSDTNLDEDDTTSMSVTFLAQIMAADGPLDLEPQPLQEAMQRPDKAKWEQAVKSEYESLLKNKTWTICDLPKGRSPVLCKWLFKRKMKSNETVDTCRYKARLGARGFSQISGLDFHETYAPVAKFQTLHTIFTLTAQQDLELHLMEVKTVFLLGHLEEEIFMSQLLGFVEKGQQSKVCKLVKSLYGLNQSPQAWNSRIHEFLTQQKFKQSKSVY